MKEWTNNKGKSHEFYRRLGSSRLIRSHKTYQPFLFFQSVPYCSVDSHKVLTAETNTAALCSEQLLIIIQS